MNISIGQWVVLLLAALCAPVAAAGLDTDSLDQSFGELGDGRQVVQLPGTSYSVANAITVDGENRILLAGSTVLSAEPTKERGVVMRLLPDGTPDGTFANLPSPLPYDADYVFWTSVLASADGGLFAAGIAYGGNDQQFCNANNGDHCWMVCKFEDNGSFDELFGAPETPGCTGPTTSGGGNAYAIAIQPDGKLLIAGVTANEAPQRATIIRLLANGSLDTTFAKQGIAKLPEQYYERSAFYALDVSVDGTIAAAGYYGDDLGIGQTNEHMLVARYGKDGAPLTKFSGGVRVVPFTQSPQGERASAAHAVEILKDNSVLLSGRTSVDLIQGNFRDRPAVVKLDANANGVAAFGMPGLPAGQRIIEICADPGANCRNLTAASVIDDGGRVWIAGEVTHTEFELTRIYALRLTPSGAIDAAFGASDGAFVPGVASVYWPNLAPGDDAFNPYALAIQRNKMVLGGQTDEPAGEMAAAIRLDNGILFADDFETD